VISIRKHLDEPNSESVQTLLRVAHILLQGMADHIVEYDPEFEAIITMLTDTVKAISSLTGDNVDRLQQIEQQVSSVVEISDIKLLKSRLGDCLDGIKKESARQRVDAEQATQSLIVEIGKARTRAASVAPPTPTNTNDPLTGCPNREAAEVAIATRCESDKTSFVAVMMIERLQLYNTRFGRVVGDDLLRSFAESVRQSLSPRDTLYRWTGPTLVVVFDRICSIEDMRRELKRLLDKIPPKTVETETRTATLSMASRWGVFPTSSPLKMLVKNIDMFTSLHSASMAQIST
jgi:diguanylate cyclase (GGDEF)-like protein